MTSLSIHRIHLESVASTNSYLKSLVEQEHVLPEWTLVTTDRQEYGRGQRGNSWESAPGQNITCSLLLAPHIAGWKEPFDLSVVTSVALLRMLHSLLAIEQPIAIKWPNDIYVAGRKIAGILIENEWMAGGIRHSIIGIGLNVNQLHFVSDAPNPTSMAQESGRRDWDREEVLGELLIHLKACYEEARTSLLELRNEYHHYLYRCDGRTYPFRRSDGTPILAQLLGVTPGGDLRLMEEGGEVRYAFKEVAFVL